MDIEKIVSINTFISLSKRVLYIQTGINKNKCRFGDFNRIKFLAEAKEINLARLNDDPDYYRDEYFKFIECDSGAKIRYIRLKYEALTSTFGDMFGCSGNAVCTWEKGQCIMGRQYFSVLKSLAQAKGKFAYMMSVSAASIQRWEREGKIRGKISYPTRERYLVLKALAEKKE